jgi:hypothetical protein
MILKFALEEFQEIESPFLSFKWKFYLLKLAYLSEFLQRRSEEGVLLVVSFLTLFMRILALLIVPVSSCSATMFRTADLSSVPSLTKSALLFDLDMPSDLSHPLGDL